jgi:hypothetical protein
VGAVPTVVAADLGVDREIAHGPDAMPDACHDGVNSPWRKSRIEAQVK